MTFPLVRVCWCKNQELTQFSSEYLICHKCETLVCRGSLSIENLRIQDNSNELYTKDYWLSYQTEQHGYPDIYNRAIEDLPERCLYWLNTLMKYKLPSAQVLELGCAHGGSVALAKWAGFDATGLELSPWVVQFAQEIFEIPMLLGPLEDQSLEPNSLDAIVLYDVLEHLPDPVRTMSYAASLLKEDGIFIVQTPQYQKGKTYQEMISENDSFLSLLTAPEHQYLFSKQSVGRFFKDLGFHLLQFEKQLFAYDMYFIASRYPLNKNSEEQITTKLLKTASGRIIQSLIDKTSELNQLNIKYHNSQEDCIDKQEECIAAYSQLKQSQNNLEITQAQLETTQRQMENLQLVTQELQTNKLQSLYHEVSLTQNEIDQINKEIVKIKESKLWQIRSSWFKFKRRLGWTGKE